MALEKVGEIWSNTDTISTAAIVGGTTFGVLGASFFDAEGLRATGGFAATAGDSVGARYDEIIVYPSADGAEDEVSILEVIVSDTLFADGTAIDHPTLGASPGQKLDVVTMDYSAGITLRPTPARRLVLPVHGRYIYLRRSASSPETDVNVAMTFKFKLRSKHFGGDNTPGTPIGE